jgi:saccharopine dehydrogenase (NAD+, L-lysine-forming)
MAAKVVILGGYGNTGRWLARSLAAATDCRLVLAGRNRAAAQAVAAELGAAAVRADARDPASLRAAFDGAALVVSAAPITGVTAQVARAAIEAGADYLDVGVGPARWKELSGVEPHGRCIIGEAGFHPGLPAALVRYAASRIAGLERAEVGSVIKIDWRGLPSELSKATMEEFVGLARDFSCEIFRDGRWRRGRWGGMADAIRMDFGREFGFQPCVPWLMEEMRPLPEMYPTLRRTGFYVGGFNWFTDWFALPAAAVAARISPAAGRALSHVLLWSLRAFSKPPYGTVLRLECDGGHLSLYHADGYVFTAVPIAACVLQWLDGGIRRPGVHMMAHVVDPARLLRDMERLGIQVEDRLPAVASR